MLFIACLHSGYLHARLTPSLIPAVGLFIIDLCLSPACRLSPCRLVALSCLFGEYSPCSFLLVLSMSLIVRRCFLFWETKRMASAPIDIQTGCHSP
eukprot:m.58063 g.58063  ORF g.58063 m.58063 type:complete len:96 (-) comp13118_c0_seq2:1286-1573(-)